MSIFRFLPLGLLTTLAHSASATITVVATTTETVVDVNAPHDSHSYPSQDQSQTLDSYPLQHVYLLLLLGIPVVWYLAWLQKARLSAQKALEADIQDDWEEPWLTDDWATLYGLIRLSNDNRWSHTPLRVYKDIQNYWHLPNRPWLKRLLALGIIPLFIQDGGMNTHHVNFTKFGRKKSSPYFTMPRWQQGKRRAYFEFLVPYPNGSAKMHQFMDSLIRNRAEEEIGDNQVVRDNSYAVTIRESPPDRGGNILYSEDNPPAPEDRPFEVGVQSTWKYLLPFMSDEVLRRGYGHRSTCLSYFIENTNPETVPLLRHAPTALVRMEAYHYGACELDAFVFGVAQKAGLEVQWPEGRCREAALEELKQCGLPADELALSGEFGPEEYM